MIQKIRVKNKGIDKKGLSILKNIKNYLKIHSITDIQTAKIYRVEGVTLSQAKTLAQKLFCEEINQDYTLNKEIILNPYSLIEIAYKPGVMNPEIASILKASRDLGIKPIAVDTSMEYGFYGKIIKEEVISIIDKLHLFNSMIEHIILDEPKTLIIKGKMGRTTIIPIRNMNNNDLAELSKDKLFLNLEELKIIQNYFKKLRRDPFDLELETIAQTWSEHCAHKTFKANLVVDGKKKKSLIQRIKEEALKHDKNIVSAFVDNSGVMNFYDGFSICGKVETHNSPSAIEPYGGAMTGSGGVFRDIVGTGQGAKCIASTDIFCFAHPNIDLKLLPNGCLPPDYLLKQVVTGVKDYGNRIGIPTNNGSVHFHNDFRAKPTVVVGAYGILPTKKALKGKPKSGDVVICIGGKTGRDGIHGATFSSGEMTEKTSEVSSSAVQIGNAIEEKRMFDAILEASQKNLITAIQDCGAGGFSSAIGEMGEKTGVEVHLDKAPLKYHGLSPWEIWISESQERMILAISLKNLKEFLQVCKRYNVETSILGRFTNSKKLQVFYRKKLICNLDMKFLHHGLPQRTMIAKKNTLEVTSGFLRGGPKSEQDWTKIIRKVLAHPNIASKEQIVRLYDHSVQGTNDLQPYSGEKLDSPNDAVVLRPFLDKEYGMVISHGLNPVLNTIDPYWGSIWACAESLANYTAVGGDYKNASLINNYIWPFPDQESLWSLDKSVDAVVTFMKKLKTPVISGKDSLSSTYRGSDGTVIKIPPVLCISVFGKIPNVSKTITSDFKKTNSKIYLVGKMDFRNMGGSIYTELTCHSGGSEGRLQNLNIPHVDLDSLPKTLDAIYKGITSGKILSCHDISEGGLITTLFEMCIGGDIGARLFDKRGDRLSLRSHDSSEVDRIEQFLFNETAGCFVVEIENDLIAKKLFASVPYMFIGKTQKEPVISVLQNKKITFNADVNELKITWKIPMLKLFP